MWRSHSENETRQILVLAQGLQACVDVVGIDPHRLARQARRVEADLVEQPLHDRGQAARADVLGALVDVEGDLRDAAFAAQVVQGMDVILHFAPISLMARAPVVAYANPKFAASDLKALIAGGGLTGLTLGGTLFRGLARLAFFQVGALGLRLELDEEAAVVERGRRPATTHHRRHVRHVGERGAEACRGNQQSAAGGDNERRAKYQARWNRGGPPKPATA